MAVQRDKSGRLCAETVGLGSRMRGPQFFHFHPLEEIQSTSVPVSRDDMADIAQSWAYMQPNLFIFTFRSNQFNRD